MPLGSDEENWGWVHVDDPVGGGGVALGVGEPEGWPPGDAVWLARALGLAVLEGGFLDADFGMTATAGVAASAGSRVVGELLALSPPVVALFEVPAAAARRGVVPCPPPRKLTAASPPAASTPTVVMPMTIRRESGNARNDDLPGPRVAPVLGPLVTWRTQPPILVASSEE